MTSDRLISIIAVVALLAALIACVAAYYLSASVQKDYRRHRGKKAVFYEVDKDALTLLQAMKEHHDQHNPDAPLSEGTRLAPELVAEPVGMNPETLRYERAVGYLVREGALVWEERLGSVPGIDFYRITRRGLEMLSD